MRVGSGLQNGQDKADGSRKDPGQRKNQILTSHLEIATEQQELSSCCCGELTLVGGYGVVSFERLSLVGVCDEGSKVNWSRLKQVG